MLIRCCVVLGSLMLPLSVLAAEPTSKIYAGLYVYDWERSEFRPKGTTERWEVQGNLEKARAPWKDKKALPPSGQAEVVLRGTLGPEGRFGHLGCCTRILTVEEVVEVKNARHD